MILTKSKNLGIVGTVFIHALLIMYLMLFGFEKKEPIAEEGLPVNFGNIDEATGLFEPAGEAANKPEIAPIPEPEPIDKTDQKMITQDQENSVSLSDKKEAEQTRIKEKQIRTEQEQKAEAIRSQTASAFGTRTGKGISQGTSLTGTGDQGVLTGGLGFGQFSLNGRSVKGGLPRPSYSIQEEGIVVVQIIVNPKGIVTTASVALKGTNTDNVTLRSAALSAAKQAHFNAIEGNQVQSGTITYRFRLK